MPDRIQGITIEIDGNTTKLQDSLKKLDGQLRTTQSSLRDVNKLLKIDPGNTELLAQKQKELGNAIQGTKLRLNELKTAQEGVKQGSEEWDRLQREIIATEQNLKSLEKEYKEFGSVAAQQIAVVGEKMQDIGGKVTDVGKGLTKNVTAPIVAAFGAAVKTTADFDSAMSQVAATMGKTTDEITELSDFAREMGSATAFSATEAAEALNYMALAGYSSEQSMKMLPTVLNLAAAGGIDLASASDMVTDAQSALGLTMEETTAMVDQMAAASSSSNTSVAQLGEAILKIGATARNTAGGTEELSTILGVLADNGIKGAEGGTHLRNILLSLQSNAENGAVSFGDFSVSIYDADGNMRSMVDIIGDVQDGLGDMTQESKDAIISGIFNKTDLAAVNALLGTSKKRFNDLDKAIRKSGGAAKKMADTQLDNLNGDITLLKSAVQELAISLGSTLVPVIRKVVGRVQEWVDKFNKLSPKTKETITKVALLAAALGPLLVAGGKLTIGIGKVLEYAPKIATAIKTVGALMNPTTLGIVAVAAAVVAIGVLIYTHWDDIKKWTKDMVDKVKEKWEALKTSITTLANNIKTGVTNAWNNIKTTTSTAWEAVKNTATGKITAIKTAFDKGGGGIKGVAAATMTAVKGYFTFGFDAINAITGGKLNAIKNAVNSAWTGIKNSVTTTTNAIKANVSAAWNNLKSAVVNTVSTLKSSVTALWTNAKNAVINTAYTLKSGVVNAWSSLKTAVLAVADSIKANVVSKWNNIKNSVTNAAASLKNGVAGAWDGLKSKISGAVDGLKSKIDSFKQKFDELRNKVTSAVSRIKSAFNFSWSLPNIKLPHFRVRGGTWPYGLGGKGSLPSISVDWYKKAYENPMMFTQPTVLQTPQGLKGFGDGHGAEIVLGLNKLRELVGTSGDVVINVYASDGMDVNALADKIQDRFVAMRNQRRAAYA